MNGNMDFCPRSQKLQLSYPTPLLFQIDAHVDKDLLEEEEEAATSGDEAASSTSCLSTNKKRLLPHTTAKTNLDKGMQVLVSYIDNIQSKTLIEFLKGQNYFYFACCHIVQVLNNGVKMYFLQVTTR